MTSTPPFCTEPSLHPNAEPGEECRAAIAAAGRCLAHLAEDELTAHLSTLTPGSPINARRVVFTAALLDQLLVSTQGNGDSPQLGEADFVGAAFIQNAYFAEATFTQHADFSGATFTKYTAFIGATFTRDAFFGEATFTQHANFDGATFTQHTDFVGATFTEHANFDRTTFTEHATFLGATFTRDANFSRATFTQNANFGEATFAQNANFGEATFTEYANFGEAAFAQNANFIGATFTRDADFNGARLLGEAVFRCAASELVFNHAEVQAELVVEGAVGKLSLVGLRSHGRVALRLRGTDVDAADAVCTGPLSVHAMAQPFDEVSEAHLSRPGRTMRVVSLQGADIERLVLTDVDLSECRFAGIHRLDQIVLDGRCTFAQDPPKSRQVLAEEHHWRAEQGGRAGQGWMAAPEGVEVVAPERVQVLYRQLRKAFEEGKNEPGAADFYYGEMEMRRAAAREGRRPDRWLLFLYWVTSGYALRTRRALACLGVVVVASIIALTLCGFPAKGKDLKADGTLTTPTGAQPIAVAVHQREPVRKVGERVGKAVEITLNAVIFRSADTELTEPGKYINLLSRLLGPLFLGFSLLAIHNRVKR